MVGDRYGNVIFGIISILFGFGVGVMDFKMGIIWNNCFGWSFILIDGLVDCVWGGFWLVNMIYIYVVINSDGFFCVGGMFGGDG